MRAKSVAVVGLVVLVLSAVGLPASADDTNWRLRFGVFYGSPTGDLSESGQTTQLDDSVGFFLNAEFLVTDRFGIEPCVGYATHEITVDEPGFPTLEFGETTWAALTINANFHLLLERKVDLYVGPTVGYVFWGAIESDEFPSDVPTDDTVALGANIGIDVPFGESAWSFTGALRYLATDLGVEGGGDIGVDPVQVKVGVSYRF